MRSSACSHRLRSQTTGSHPLLKPSYSIPLTTFICIKLILVFESIELKSYLFKQSKHSIKYCDLDNSHLLNSVQI